MKQKKINYGKQKIDAKDIIEVKKSLEEDFITTGPYVEKFENLLKKKFKSKFAVSCINATAGLHLAFLALNLKKGDVVLMPSINFISSYRMASLLGAKIYLVDVDENTGQITPQNILKCIKINKIKKIKILVTMYLGGYVENNTELFSLKKRFKFSIVEDACHAIGAKYKFKNKNYFIGSCKHSDICVFSFHPVKTITTGEGGAVLTNNKQVAATMKLQRSHGILRNKRKYWDYDIKNFGFNYRLSDINCALGFSQLKKIDKFFVKRKKIFDLYKKNFSKFTNYIYLPKTNNLYNLYHLFLIGIDFKKLKTNKNNFIKFLVKRYIYVQFHYKPIFKFSFYKNNQSKDFPGTKKYYDRYVSLPIYSDLSLKEQKFVIKTIIEFLRLNIRKKL